MHHLSKMNKSLSQKVFVSFSRPRLRVVPHFPSGIVERAKRERVIFLSPRRVSRGLIFTPARVSLALLSWMENEGLLLVYSQPLNALFSQAFQFLSQTTMTDLPTLSYILTRVTPTLKPEKGTLSKLNLSEPPCKGRQREYPPRDKNKITLIS